MHECMTPQLFCPHVGMPLPYTKSSQRINYNTLSTVSCPFISSNRLQFTDLVIQKDAGAVLFVATNTNHEYTVTWPTKQGTSNYNMMYHMYVTNTLKIHNYTAKSRQIATVVVY